MPDGLRELARHQAGVISREQMLAFGLSDRVASRLVRQEIWRRVTPGLLALSDETWLQLAWAGVLLGGSAAILGGRTAAHLWGIERDPPTQITVFVGRERRIARDDRWRFVRSDRLGVGDPPRTRLPQTIVDLAPSLNPDQLTSLLADVVGSNRVRPGDILRVVRQTPRLANRKLLCDLLGDVAAGVDSPLELRYLRDVERAHGLPRAARRER
ncbi:MAG: type IV toxin-antitoxin system AbiEi family antitoxin domain-containing protein, partial [Propionicimonas sp.]